MMHAHSSRLSCAHACSSLYLQTVSAVSLSYLVILLTQTLTCCTASLAQDLGSGAQMVKQQQESQYERSAESLLSLLCLVCQQATEAETQAGILAEEEQLEVRMLRPARAVCRGLSPPALSRLSRICEGQHHSNGRNGQSLGASSEFRQQQVLLQQRAQSSAAPGEDRVYLRASDHPATAGAMSGERRRFEANRSPQSQGWAAAAAASRTRRSIRCTLDDDDSRREGARVSRV